MWKIVCAVVTRIVLTVICIIVLVHFLISKVEGNINSVTFLLILFFILLCIFHALFVTITEKSFWIFCEYIYYGAALLALITVVISFDKMIMYMQVQYSEDAIAYHYTYIKDEAVKVAESIDNILRTDQHRDYLKEEEINAYTNASQWFHKFVDILVKSYESKNWEDITKDIKGSFHDILNTSVYTEDENKSLRHLLIDLNYHRRVVLAHLSLVRDLYKEVKSKKQLVNEYNIYEILKTFLAPWVGSIALALRVTKVSSDLLAYTKSKK
jgi:hypothetical protein